MHSTVRLVAAAAALSLALPATAWAAMPTRVSTSQTTVFCEVDGEIGYGSVFVQIVDSGAFADVAIWLEDTDPESEPPSLITSSSSTSWEGTSLTATFELVRAEPPHLTAASAVLRAVLSADGEIQDFGSRHGRDGNRLFRSTQTLQLLNVLGTITIDLAGGPSEVVELAGCGASTFVSTYFGTNPNAWVYGGKQLFVSCSITTEVGAVTLLVIADESGALAELVVNGGDQVWVGLTSPELTENALAATFDLSDVTGSGVSGTARISAVLSPSGERITDHKWDGPYRLSTVGEALFVTGSVDLTIGGRTTSAGLGDETCKAGDVRVQVVEIMRGG